MVRYGKEHKQATRQRIIETAGRRLKRDGIDGSGRRDPHDGRGADQRRVLRPLRVQGGPGRHRGRRRSCAASASGSARCRPAAPASSSSCASTSRPSTATIPGRAARPPRCWTRSAAARTPTKEAYTDGVLAIIDDIAARLAPHDPPSARAKTLGIYALMVGTLQLSRALADRQLADEILEQGIRNALTLLDA